MYIFGTYIHTDTLKNTHVNRRDSLRDSVEKYDTIHWHSHVHMHTHNTPPHDIQKPLGKILIKFVSCRENPTGTEHDNLSYFLYDEFSINCRITPTTPSFPRLDLPWWRTAASARCASPPRPQLLSTVLIPIEFLAPYKFQLNSIGISTVLGGTVQSKIFSTNHKGLGTNSKFASKCWLEPSFLRIRTCTHTKLHNKRRSITLTHTHPYAYKHCASSGKTETNTHAQTRLCMHIYARIYRVAETHRIPYLYRSFSAQVTCI